MPRWILSSRHAELTELMDAPDCDPVLLDSTYVWFARMNPWLARWRSVYKRHVRPLLHAVEHPRILDLGCGGGDVARLIRHLARRDGFAPEILGIDPEERAISFARNHPDSDGIGFRACFSGELVQEGVTFDLVISNHVLHHLDEKPLRAFLSDSRTLSCNLVLHNDIQRDDLAWLGFWPIGAIPHLNSFILTDGLRSVRRAWHPDEILPLLPTGWRAESMAPFRMLLMSGGEHG